MTERSRCGAPTTRGGRCRRLALAGERRCALHGRHGRVELTSGLADRLVSMIRAGNTVRATTDAVGVSRQTFGDWMRRGRSARDPEDPYRQLADRVEQARAEAEVRHVTQVATAASDDWRAATWMLERQLQQVDDDDDRPALDVEQIAADAEAQAREEARATLQAIGESLDLNGGAIDRYAMAVAAWRTLEGQWAAAGRPATTLGGATGTAHVPHPLVAQITVARREAALLGATLGLDPHGRSKLARRVGSGRPPGAASAPDRVAAAPPRRQLRAVE